MTAVALLAVGVVIIMFLDGSLMLLGPLVAAAGCVFLIQAVTD